MPPPSRPCLRDQRFAAHRPAAEGKLDALQRLPLEAAAKEFGPVNDETTIGRPQRRDRDAGLDERIDPAAIGPEPRPACSAQGKHGGIRMDRDAALRAVELEIAVGVPTVPVVTQLEGDAGRSEAPEPGTQQRRSLHRLREHPPARSDERGLAKSLAPGAQVRGRKSFDGRSKTWFGIAVASEQARELFAVRKIETAAAGEQELAPDRRHPIVDGHACPAAGDHLGRHQAGGTATDDGNVRTGGG